MELKTYEQVAESYNLSPKTRQRYIAYMRLRWPDSDDEWAKCITGYAGEWANIFRSGTEYLCVDDEGKKILHEVDWQ
jgi:hypothetical protein